MTINAVIALVDALAVNQVETPLKVLWLSNLDRQIAREVHETHEGAWAPFPGYDGDTPLDTELLVPAPYDEVYRWYLEMKLWDAEGEITRYNNAAAKYNAALLAYMDWVNRTHRPLGRRALKLV